MEKKKSYTWNENPLSYLMMIVDLLDLKGFKPITVLKDDPGFKNLIFLTQFKLKLPLEEFKRRNPGLSLTSTGVTLPSDKTDKTPLDYILCVS